MIELKTPRGLVVSWSEFQRLAAKTQVLNLRLMTSRTR